MDSLTRRRLIVALAACALALSAAASGRPPNVLVQWGAFALHGAKQQITSRLIEARSGNATDVQIEQFNSGKQITDYHLAMTKYLHFVVVRDDFGSFMHVHPKLVQVTGTFFQQVTLDPGHRYYAFADSEPHGVGQQVFRFVLQRAAPLHRVAAALPASASVADAGPYHVSLSTTHVFAGKASTIYVTIEKHGKPASDLSPYLGAAAHAVFVNSADLSYVHVHPMVGDATSDMNGTDMPDMSRMSGPAKAGPKMMLHAPVLARGSYKLWLQFDGGGKIYVAPFTLVAQ